ncbi:MAG: hypothetical protein ACRC46_04195 [Thermoguttaceae bacterium]
MDSKILLPVVAMLFLFGGVAWCDTLDENSREFAALQREMQIGITPQRAAQALRPEATFLQTDRDPLDVVLRRTRALLEHLRQQHVALDDEMQRLDSLQKSCDRAEVADTSARKKLFADATALREKIALKNPLLDFRDILFIKRHFNPESEKTGNHMCDQFFGFHARPGGGVFVLENAFTPNERRVRNIVEGRTVIAGDVVAGDCTERPAATTLDASWGFLAPELSFDATKLLFCAADTKTPRHVYEWTCENSYHIFEMSLDGTQIVQLTYGAFEDIDPCYLPNGRIAFISSRRGGFGRCHGRPVPSYTLHSMNRDGSDITMLSPHETNEWHPRVDQNGMIVYTRWDYVDRGFNQAHHPWTTFPDGRDPRAIHGNASDVESSRPQFETSVLPIPNSHKLLGTAAMHHGQYFGSVLLIDPTVADDDSGGEPMGPVRRVTPEQLFPEVENAAHKDAANYGQPFPLSEDFYLVAYDAMSGMGRGTDNNYGLYLLDSFGNKVLLYRDPAISIQCPIPVKPREVPPVLPHLVDVGRPLAEGEKFTPTDKSQLATTAKVGVVDVYRTVRPFPPQTKIESLRIVQLLPKTNHIAHDPPIGYGDQKGARKILGTVPVESDGSVSFTMPVDVPVYFQLLDSEGVAVQTMRSATYVKPGETLVCLGCHEGRQSSATRPELFKSAFRRTPSEIEPEMAGTNPFSYPQLIQPIWDKHCVDCHATEAAAGKTFPLDRGTLQQHFSTSFEKLRPYVFYFNDAAFTQAKTVPGKFGANASRLWSLIKSEHYNVVLSREELRAVALWLDNNGDFYGVYDKENLEAVRRGETVEPSLE